MDRKILLGGIVGGALILIFALGPLIGFGILEGGNIAQDSLLFTLAMMFLAPIAGGFLAGLISRADPHRAGLLAGLVGSMALFILYLVFSGVSWQATVSGLVVVFVWTFLARIGSGFAATR
jgi:hypothetical protein